jgi:methyl-accepting chemotaxis protein
MEAKAATAVKARNNGAGRGPGENDDFTDQQLRELLQALQAMKIGDFSARLPGDWTGVMGQVADTFNDISSSNHRMAAELERVGYTVGREGRTKQRVKFVNRAGAWGEMEGSVNSLIDDLLWPTEEMTRAVNAVAQGDLLQTVRLEVDGRPLKGEFLRSAKIMNTMIRQLREFSSEVIRVAREVGAEGKLGGQAQVREVTGVWKELTESVNSMADNLTSQVRNIAEVTIAVANGDLSKKITVDVRGEILQLKDGKKTLVVEQRSFDSWRCRHVEGFDRLGQRHVRQLDGPGAQHRDGDDGGGARRLEPEDHSRRARRNS